MKKIYTFLALILLTASAFAQTPEKISYQAVIRNAGNTLVSNQIIGMQISILQTSATGTAVYVETQTPTTNANGLISIEIGSGTVVFGTFANIDWSAGTYFIKTEIDPTGGTSYTITGTSQLLSVPYALHAKTAESIAGGITETDPIYSAWDKSTGISITENQISDLGNYLTSYTETDPIYTAKFDLSNATNGDLLQFDGTKFVKFTPNYLTSYTETDPIYSAWDKSTGISITENQISDLGNYLTSYTETDPIYTAKFDLSNATNGDLLQFDGTKYVKFTPNYLTSEVDGSITNEIELPTNAANGDMAYWNGSAWVVVPATENEGATLQMIGGVPTWTGGIPPIHIGDFRDGGVVFYLDATGQHGLVCAVSDQGGLPWGCQIQTNAIATAIGTGAQNTLQIENVCSASGTPAYLCANLVSNGYSDWFLPSKDELHEIYLHRAVVEATCLAHSGSYFQLFYWSSSEEEFMSDSVWSENFFEGGQGFSNKMTNYFGVRAVRAF